MNASSLGCFHKGAVLNTNHTTPSVARVFKAAFFFRRLAMRGPRKVRACTAQQRGALLCFGLLGRNRPKAKLAKLLPRLGRPDVVSVLPCVAVGHVLFGRQAFKVLCSVVSFLPVYVMDVFGRVKRLQPTRRHDSVHEMTPPKGHVPVGVVNRCIGKKLSESFSAARNGVKVVKESVLDSVYVYANHVVPQKVTKESSF